MGYLAHARLNLRYAWKWLRGRQARVDVLFELRNNWRRV
jgi:hypothetical protein